MEITKEKKGDIVVLHIDGKVNVTSTPQLMTELQNLIEDGTNFILLDLEKVAFLSSSGIGTIAATFNDLKERDGALKLAGLSSELLHVFEITGLNKRIQILKTVEEGLSSF